MAASKRFIHRTLHAAWLSFAAVIIVFALLVSVTRLLFPLLQDYKTDLEQIISNQIGRQVTLGKISAEWIGLWPSMHFTDVTIYSADKQQAWIRLADLRATIDIYSTLTQGAPSIRSIRAEGLDLEAKRTSRVRLDINGETFHLQESSAEHQQSVK